MERGSDKHTPRLDEQLKQDTRSMVQGAPVEARAQEGREQEGPGDDEPTPDMRLSGDRAAGDQPSLTYEEIETRTELARHLQPSVFPADRDALLASAVELHAPANVTELLSQLPDGTFANVEAVWESLGGRREPRA